MSKSARVEVVDGPEGVIRTRVRFDGDEFVGYRASLRIEEHVRVKDSRAVHDHRVVETHDFTVDGTEHVFDTPEHSLELFTYEGRMIDLEVRAKLVVDDGVLWDTTLEEQVVRRLGRSPEVETDPKSAVDPRDAFNLVSNLAAIPLVNRVVAIGLILAGGVVLAFNTFVGVHDQVVQENEVYFYSQRDSDGETSSPFVNSLFASGAAGAAVWFGLKSQLRTYMRFQLATLHGRIDRNALLTAREMLTGRSRVDLRNTTVRIVACNMEKGQYERGSGTDERTVSFSEPVRAVVLYEKTVPLIARRKPVEDYFDDPVDFAPMFDALYPPMTVSSTHGLELHWEVQLLHDDLVDQELVASTSLFDVQEFYRVEHG